MKKKIILILSMLSLLVCVFAVSVSASHYIDLSDLDITESTYSLDIKMYNSNSCGCGFTSNEIDSFGIICISESSNHDYTYGLFNLEHWNLIFEENNINSSDKLASYIQSLADENKICNCGGMSMSYEIQMNAEYFYNLYNEYLAKQNAPTLEDLTSQYNQGKTDGVTEYKESEEYTTALETKYQAGLNDFKESEEYSTALKNAESEGYLVGTTDGVAAYKLSEEYNNALKDKYTTGYNDGVESVENTESGSNTLGIVFGSVGIGVVVLAIFCGIMALRKKPKVRI